jgi:hypothetical protein
VRTASLERPVLLQMQRVRERKEEMFVCEGSHDDAGLGSLKPEPNLLNPKTETSRRSFT